MTNELEHLAAILRRRNEIDQEIASAIGRPMTAGHLGEHIASMIFDIQLDESASARAVDGRFRSGPWRGETVNIKWYLKREGLLDMTLVSGPDRYLVLAGPKSAAASSRGAVRPWVISEVFCFGGEGLVSQLGSVKIGVATSVRSELWDASRIYSMADTRTPTDKISATQIQLLRLFAPAAGADGGSIGGPAGPEPHLT